MITFLLGSKLGDKVIGGSGAPTCKVHLGLLGLLDFLDGDNPAKDDVKIRLIFCLGVMNWGIIHRFL